MFLVVLWSSFTILMAFCEELDQQHYLLFSSFMLYIIYLSNKVKPFRLTLRGLLISLSIPNFIFGYIIFVYNDFLAVNPISYEFLTAVSFTYIYILVYAFLENKLQISREKH